MEHSKPPKLSYAASGVDIDAADEAKRRIQTLVRKTFTSGVMSDIGSFGALFRLPMERFQEPLLVSSCDGVGTKLKVAFMTGVHDTVGYDLVSHCVSDILVQGARPLFFLDYIACGRMTPSVVESVVSGLVRGCSEMGCALIGGETAEMPDFYPPGEYDLAGFIVGVVERSQLVDGSGIKPGDRILGLASLGLHTNGYSLARKLLFDHLGYLHSDTIPELAATVSEVLLAPHRSYYPLIEPLLDRRWIKGMAHITGGGITENLPRMLPKNTAAEIRKGSWPILPVFSYLQEKGGVDENDMYRTFNMGIGMILVVEERDLGPAIEYFRSLREPCYELGAVTVGDRKVRYS